MNPSTNWCLGAVTAIALGMGGCVDDTRAPLTDCDFGLYWADCGGDGEPVVGCDRETGDCRWFAGGVTALGHATSDCPPSDPCCHDGWPFSDYSPSGRALDRSVDQMSLLMLEPIDAGGASVTVLADLSGSTEPGLECELEQCPAAVTVQRVGHSIVAFQGGDSPFRRQIELVVGAGGLGWAVHLYELREGTRDLPTRPECGGGYTYARERAVTDATLHVASSGSLDPGSLHGVLEGTAEVDGIPEGGRFTLRF